MLFQIYSSHLDNIPVGGDACNTLCDVTAMRSQKRHEGSTFVFSRSRINRLFRRIDCMKESIHTSSGITLY